MSRGSWNSNASRRDSLFRDSRGVYACRATSFLLVRWVWLWASRLEGHAGECARGHRLSVSRFMPPRCTCRSTPQRLRPTTPGLELVFLQVFSPTWRALVCSHSSALTSSRSALQPPTKVEPRFPFVVLCGLGRQRRLTSGTVSCQTVASWAGLPVPPPHLPSPAGEMPTAGTLCWRFGSLQDTAVLRTTPVAGSCADADCVVDGPLRLALCFAVGRTADLAACLHSDFVAFGFRLTCLV